MKIASAEVIPYALPFREPYVTARGTLTQREMVLLRLRDEDGFVGLGEAVPLSMRGSAGLERVVTELRALGDGGELARQVEGAGLGETAWWPEEIEISSPARCAVLTALLDLGGKQAAAGRSATAPDGELIGVIEIKSPPKPVPCNATLVAGKPAAVAEDALRWAAEGYSTFKLKLGAGDDVAQVRAVREALGADAQIRIDANAAWDLATAKRVLAELEPFEIQLAEQPVATIEEAAELAQSTSIPLAGDESIENSDDAERAEQAGAFQLTGIKLSKVGGLLPALYVAQALPAYASSALDGPVGIAAGARLADKLRDLPWPANGERSHGLATQRLFSSTIASVECELRDGSVCEPPGPGLGVEIDEAALEAHRL